MLLSDDEQTLARYRHAPDEAFDVAPGWLYEGMAQAYQAGRGALAIAGDDPRCCRRRTPTASPAPIARARNHSPALELISSFAINWTIIAAATPAWARCVFPNDPEDRALEIVDRSSPPRASTGPIRSANGPATMRRWPDAPRR